jgi:DNA-binding phage protein
VTRDEIIECLRLKAKDIGITEIARRSILAREHVYQVLDSGNPTLTTLIKLAKAMGLKVRLEE